MTALSTFNSIIQNVRNERVDQLVDYRASSVTAPDVTELPWENQFARMATYSPGVPASWTENRDQYSRQFIGSTYIAIGAIARMAAMQEAKVKWRREKKGRVVYEDVSPSHPLCQLLEYVNEQLTQWDLWYYMVGWRFLCGDSFTFKAMNGFGITKMLHPIPPQWVHVIPDENNFIAGYRVQPQWGGEFFIPHQAVIHLQNPSLDWSSTGRYYGMPSVKAAAVTIELENEMFKRRYYKEKSLCRPGLIFKTPRILQPKQLQQLWGNVTAQWSMAENTGRPMILHGDLDLVDDLSNKGQELDYTTSLDKTLEYSLAVHGVPKTVVGMADANKAAFDASLKQFCMFTMNPLLKQMSQHLTHDLAHDFDPELEIKLGPCNVDDQDALRKDIELMIKAGAITPDEVRHRLRDMPALDGDIGSKPIMVSGFQRVGSGGEDSTVVGRQALGGANTERTDR